MGMIGSRVPRLVPHVKGIELVGLTIMLVAWTMDWFSIQKRAKDRASYQELSKAIHDMDTRIRATDLVRYEANLTRWSQHNPPPKDKLYDVRAAAWSSPEVRATWVAMRSQDIFSMQMQLVLVINMRRDVGLTLDDADLKHAASEVQALLDEFQSKTVEFKVGGEPQVRLDVKNLSFKDTFPIGERIDRISSLCRAGVTKTGKDLEERMAFSTCIYRWLFVLGSAILIGSKLVGWYGDTRAKEQHAPPSDVVAG